MIPANNTSGGIHELIGMIQAVQDTPETEAARARVIARQRHGLSDADLSSLAMDAFAAREAERAERAAGFAQMQQDFNAAATEQFTAEVLDGAAAATSRRQRPGSSLGINT